jgi:hypothetical protein
LHLCLIRLHETGELSMKVRSIFEARRPSQREMAFGGCVIRVRRG